MKISVESQTVRAKENLKMVYDLPTERQTSGLNPHMKVSGQGIRIYHAYNIRTTTRQHKYDITHQPNIDVQPITFRVQVAMTTIH